MMRRTTTLALICAAFALAACSGGNGTARQSTLGGITAAAKTLYDQWGAEDPQPVVVTRALLDQTPGQVMQVIPDRTGLQDFLRLIATRRDAAPGVIEVWQSSDGAQFVLRGGVLVGTKGLGGDIKASQASATLAGFDGQGGGGSRSMNVARTNGLAQTVTFNCTMAQQGRETIQIVDQRVSVFRMQETCTYNDARFTNTYWVETGTAKMRKSRQWAGPTFGYVAFERLKNE